VFEGPLFSTGFSFSPGIVSFDGYNNWPPLNLFDRLAFYLYTLMEFFVRVLQAAWWGLVICVRIRSASLHPCGKIDMRWNLFKFSCSGSFMFYLLTLPRCSCFFLHVYFNFSCPGSCVFWVFFFWEFRRLFFLHLPFVVFFVFYSSCVYSPHLIPQGMGLRCPTPGSRSDFQVVAPGFLGPFSLGH